MSNEEKQIEEIKNVLIHTCKRIRTREDDIMQDHYAKALYNAGYRKQSENTVELPCNLNAEIWYIDKNYTIQKAEVSSVNIKASSRHIIATRYVWETEETIKLALMFEHLNIDYWLTKEEAEEALAKMKGGAE